MDNLSVIGRIIFYFHYPFVRYALLVGVLIALCSSLLGVTLVLKRYSFIGDGLSHVAFGGMAVASVLDMTEKSLLIIPITIIVAILLLKTGINTKIKGDAMIAILSVGALAIGYMLMNVFSTSANISGDVCSTLFGSTSILTLTIEEVITCIILSIVIMVLYIIFYNKIFTLTFDEVFARASGLKVDFYNLLIAIMIAIIIVLGMNLVGSLLISALVIFPALSTMRLVKSFKMVVILSSIISVFAALSGMILSIAFSTPVGSTIVVINMVIFLICIFISRALRL